MRETAHATIVNNCSPLALPPRVSQKLKTPSLDEDISVTNLLQRFEGYKADRMESTRARGDVCGRSEIRRIKGGFRVPGGTLDSLVTSFAKQSGLQRRIRLRFGADSRRNERYPRHHVASLESQWGKRVKNLLPPPLIFAREQRNYAVGVRCGFSRTIDDSISRISRELPRDTRCQ